MQATGCIFNLLSSSMKYRLVFIMFLIAAMARAQDSCSDSSTHLQYRSLAGDFLRIEKTILTTDGSKVSIGVIRDDHTGTRGFVSRIDKAGEVLWFKKFTAPFAAGECQFESVTEAANGNIFVATESVQSDNQPYFLLVLSPGGELLFQRKLGFTNIPRLGNRFVRTPLLTTFGRDSVLVLFQSEPETGEGELLTLCTLDNSGQPGQAFTFSAPAATLHAPYFDRCRRRGDIIELFGVTQFWNGCLVNSEMQPAFCYLKIDWREKKVLDRKIYCSPAEGSTAGYVNAYYDAFPANNGRHNIFLQANGHVVFTRAYMGLEFIGTDTLNRLFSISEFDENFQPVKSEYLIARNRFKSGNYYELFIDSFNNRQLRIQDQPGGKLYYAVSLNGTGFALQKVMPFQRPLKNERITRQNFAEPGYFTSFHIISADGIYSYLDDYRILTKDTAQSCFGSSEGFLSYSAAAVTRLDWQGSFTVRQAVVESTAVLFTAGNYPLERTVVCATVRKCDTLKLHAPEMICAGSGPVFITAYKNPLCPGKVEFLFDTLQAASFSQPDDSTLRVVFKNEWKGWIYGKSAVCDLVKDSVQLMVAPQAKPVNLGRDTILCRGNSYLLEAGQGYKTYRWQDGSTASHYIVNRPGLYYVTAEDYCGRMFSDSIRFYPGDYTLALVKDTSICRSEVINLQAAEGFSKYSWSPSYNLHYQSETLVSVFPEVTTVYEVEAEKFPGCVLRDSILVLVKDCPESFFAPSAFSPNGDGRNDQFRPLISGALKSYEFSIYNRWGDLVFHTKNKQAGWNGMYRNKQQETGVFVWVCKYQFFGKPPQVKTATVLLIR
jgi:gliding motility-associated-like protein